MYWGEGDSSDATTHRTGTLGFSQAVTQKVVGMAYCVYADGHQNKLCEGRQEVVRVSEYISKVLKKKKKDALPP